MNTKTEFEKQQGRLSKPFDSGEDLAMSQRAPNSNSHATAIHRPHVCGKPAGHPITTNVCGSIEHVLYEDSTLFYIIRAEFKAESTFFPTPADLELQCGFVVYPTDGVVKRHVHLHSERHLTGAPEVIQVREGRCKMDMYDSDKNFLETTELGKGDIVIAAGGGHGFRMLEDTILFEVKLGPYRGVNADKERF
jgi:hypothetical protein